MKSIALSALSATAGIALGVYLTEIVENYRKKKEMAAYADDPVYADDDAEEEEELYEEDDEDFITPNPTTVVPENSCAIFFINKSLKMRKGKISAQCGHASLGIFKKTAKVYPKVAAYWFDNKFDKVFFNINDQQQMEQYAQKALDAGYLFETIVDAGRTQIAAGSHTILVVGPIDKSNVAEFTKGLQQVTK
ncbi:hypothetical protein TVAG_248450 [Trichomonas vaginalis G3]|uniref:peptidyl-tRNA hydrolase n=1 Tax=Trichomonas vaginalis (strain ATCC PRA-98 / G3) TaxID=412133 RepID=A2E781_TRIV3|nr:aminoacyl-tRNA hydrolase protein [Trichomonas vaginalis G3]EAY11478.1 hypothetical protein TVAG_248450 [Trichomonas vaginalis G3]KAI5526760.1 aminoacyl-tRNA hydrolase protein [Trichomonas vaginalis G3]|eukprot:XP_001323701.1 hypothetical protein [Trichomonas vaginalis G3]